MCGWPIIQHLFICFFYLIQLNIISLTSPKITLVLLFITAFLEFHFYLEKTGPAKTRAVGPFPLALYGIKNKIQVTVSSTKKHIVPFLGTNAPPPYNPFIVTYIQLSQQYCLNYFLCTNFIHQLKVFFTYVPN